MLAALEGSQALSYRSVARDPNICHPIHFKQRACCVVGMWPEAVHISGSSPLPALYYPPSSSALRTRKPSYESLTKAIARGNRFPVELIVPHLELARTPLTRIHPNSQRFPNPYSL